MVRWLSIASFALACGVGCRATFTPEVARGPAISPAHPAIVLFPVACHSGDDKCKDEYSDAIKGKIGSELEFAGYRVIDGEKLVREPRTREDTTAGLYLFREKILAATSRHQVGSLFEDLPPGAREELLKAAKADGTVSASINMLASGPRDNWVVEVQVRYALTQDNQTVWVARCKHESYWNEKDSWSIEQAADCALKGALGR